MDEKVPLALLAFLVHQALEQSKETGEMPEFLDDQEYQDHVETLVVLVSLDFKAVLVLKDKEVTLALVVYVEHQGSLENQEIMGGMDPKD